MVIQILAEDKINVAFPQFLKRGDNSIVLTKVVGGQQTKRIDNKKTILWIWREDKIVRTGVHWSFVSIYPKVWDFKTWLRWEVQQWKWAKNVVENHHE